jgi:hydroxyethylthiazole kinase-like uncharacterized protein yjeF
MSGPIPITPEALRDLPLPSADGGDKNERGRVLVVAGSVQVPGAAILAGTGALRVGAGKVRIGTCARNTALLGLLFPEAFVIGVPETQDGGMAPEGTDLLDRSASGSDAVLIGPGMMDDAAVSALTARLLRRTADPCWVLDAAAMSGLRERREELARHAGRIVVTPHPGEMAGILQAERRDVEADPIGAARTLAADLGIVVALKDARTHIVSPQGEAWRYEVGNPGLGTAGSGDTLAGIIAGLLARGAEPITATCWGVYLHGEAGNRLARKRGPMGYLARELLDEIPAILAEASA